MKRKPVVDFKNFRLSKLNTPEFSYLKWLLAWIGYFLAYILTENLIPEENCHVIHCWLDDIIPFCEVFVIPYVLWFLLVAGSLFYFMLYNPESMKNLMKFIIITQVAAVIIYIVYPNCQNMRPVEFERDNILTKIVGFLYAVDTSTNVFPSLHVAYSLAILSVWVKEKDVSGWWKAFIVVFVILICMATTFIKQHSVLDALGALIICIVGEIIVFGKSYYAARWAKRRAKKLSKH